MKQTIKHNLGIGMIVCLFVSLLSSIPRILKGDHTDYEIVLVNIIYTFFLGIICWVIHHFFIHTQFKWIRADFSWLKYIFSIVLGILFSIQYHTIVSRFIDFSPLLFENADQSKKTLILLFRGLLVSGFLFFVAYYLNLLTATQRSKIENERLKKENLQARLESLKQQISPHFLFNTLNTLSSISNELKVKDYIAEISNVYRYLLQYKESDLVTVEEELKFVQSYLYVLHERFEEGLQVEMDINHSIMKTKLPPLALQALVENAVKHNIISAHKPLRLQMTSNDQFIMVKNNFQPKQSLSGESSNSGLNNINERYKLLANREIVIEKNELHFIVKLPVLP
jgi:two-component system, LytTR family, sensor kinase